MSSARCKVSGCRRKAHARGLCQKHYDEKRKSKTSRKVKAVPSGKATARKSSRRMKVSIEDDENGKLCRAPGCASPHHAKGYCKMHYGQLRRRGNTVELPEEEATGTSELSMDERLVEIKKRHELLKREIANIHKALESETDAEPEAAEEEEEATE